MTRRPRIAIAHDYLTQRGGVERVVLALAGKYLDAPTDTTLYDPEVTFPEFRAIDVRSSVLNAVSVLGRNHRPRSAPVVAGVPDPGHRPTPSS